MDLRKHGNKQLKDKKSEISQGGSIGLRDSYHSGCNCDDATSTNKSPLNEIDQEKARNLMSVSDRNYKAIFKVPSRSDREHKNLYSTTRKSGAITQLGWNMWGEASIPLGIHPLLECKNVVRSSSPFTSRSCLGLQPCPSPSHINQSSCPSPSHINQSSCGKSDEFPYPVQSKRFETCSLHPSALVPQQDVQVLESIGDPSLNIYRVKLPWCFRPILEQIKFDCEMHASTLANGWYTELYSLTKQDIPLRDIPTTYHLVQPLVHYLKRCLALVASSYVPGPEYIYLDRNQPHVLKYYAGPMNKSNCGKLTTPSIRNDKRRKGPKRTEVCKTSEGPSPSSNHTGVELHHDKCDFTINLMLSHPSTYEGGGTFFPAAKETVRLDYGEFLIHPGGTVHSGVDITHGTRYLFIVFADIMKKTASE